jgi:uncharacterized membrane protein
MRNINTKITDLIMLGVIISTFLIYFFDIFKDEMIMSGFIVVILVSYTGLIWSEKADDERDEYIRARTGHVLYITTLILALSSIVYKTFTHSNYFESVCFLTVLALVKVITSRYFREYN